MKRRAAGIVLACMICASLSGCGIHSALAAGTAIAAGDDASSETIAEDSGAGTNDTETEDSSAFAEESDGDSAEETSAAAESASEDSSGAEGEDDPSDSGDASEEDNEDSGITFENQVLVDNEECSITVKGIDPDGKQGYTLSMEVENKSSDKTYMFGKKEVYVNGVYMTAIWSDKVTAGKKSIEDLYFYDYLLESFGIETITDIQMTVYAYDVDGSSTDYVAEETVHIYPYGEENATVYERQALDTDQILMDNEYVTVIVTGFEVQNDGDYEIGLYLVNKTDVQVLYCLDDVSVNDYIVDAGGGVWLAADKQCKSSFQVDQEDLEDCGITDPEEGIDTIELLLEVYSAEIGYSEPLVSETVTICP